MFKKALSLLLCICLLMSCMVWPGMLVHATETVYTCDFTDYAVTARADIDQYGGSIAQLVDTSDTTRGQAMQLTYEAGATTGKAGFRFFAGTDSKVAFAADVYAMVEFSYKVEQFNNNAELRVLFGSLNWSGEIFNSREAVGEPNHVVAAQLTPTATAGEWQKVAVLVASNRASSAIHIYLEATDASAEEDSSVLIDDITVTADYAASSVTFDYGYDSLTETVLGEVGDAVAFPENPVRNGYAFQGWYADQELTVPATEAVFPESGEALTLYAGWQECEHTYDNACDAICDACGYEREITHDMSVLNKDADGHWYTCSVCGEAGEKAAHGYDSNADTTCNECGHERESIKVTVTFDYGYDSLTETVTGVAGEAVPFPADPTREGHTFLGWNTEDSGLGEFITSAVFGDEGDTITYYAIWVDQGTYTYFCDFTDYAINDENHVSSGSGVLAQVVDSGEEEYGQSMQVSYSDGATANQAAGFRFFADTDTTVTVGYGVYTKVDFAYKVQKMVGDAELRVMAGSINWGTLYRFNDSDSTSAAHWTTAAELSATEESGEWQTASVIVAGARNAAGIHIYLRADDPTSAAGSSILIDNVKVTVNCDGSSVVFDHGYDSLTETVLGEVGDAVAFPENPVRNGYAFQGWYADQELTVPATEAVFPESGEALTLYAGWQECEHTYDNACDAICDACGYEREITHDMSVLNKDADGHWYACSVCGEAGEEAAHGYDSNADTTCNECGHERESIKVTVILDYGYDGLAETVTGVAGEAVPFPADPVREGYTFLGWNTEDSALGEFVTSATFSDEVTYYAIWRDQSSYTYFCDFTDYAINSASDMSSSNGVLAQVIDSGEEGYGQSMQVSYDEGATANRAAGFRFFAGTDTAVTVGYGVYTKIDFTYKVQKMVGDAELRVMAGSINWGPPHRFNDSDSVLATHWATAAELSATEEAGEWQTASVILAGARNAAGIHIYLRADDPTSAAGSSVLVDNVKVTVNCAASSVTFDHEEHDHLATVSGKVTANGSGQVSEVTLRNVFQREIARVTTGNNGKYTFVNVQDGLYFITALTESDGMGMRVIVVLHGDL